MATADVEPDASAPGDAAPRGRAASRFGRLLALLLIPLPWAYGAVHAPVRGAYIAAVALLFLGAAVYRIRAGGRPAASDGATVLLLAALGWAALAVVPLPAPLLAVLAPGSYRIAVAHFAEAGLEAPSWHPVALAPRDAAEALATALAHGMVFLVAARTLSGRRSARLLAGAIALPGALLALLAMAQQALGASRIYFVGLAREQFYGTFVNGNHAATFLGASALCGLGLMLRERDTGRKILWGLTGVISAIGAMYSLSRGGVLALAAGLVVFLGAAALAQAGARRPSADEIGRFYRKNAVPLMLAGLAIFYLSWLGPKRIGRELATLASLDLPQDYRARVWSDAAGVLGDWPLTGSGPGTFGHVFPGYRSFAADVTTEMAESDWIQLAVENGVVGFALVAAFVALLLGRFGALLVRDPGRVSGAHLGLAAALLAIVAHAMIDFPLRIPAIGATAAAIAGCLAGTLHRRKHRLLRNARKHAPAARRARRPVLFAWLLLPVAALAALAFSRGERAPRVPRTRDAAIALLRERPADARAWIRFARVLESEGEPAAIAYGIASRLDRGDPAVQRAVALGLARAGEAARAAEVLGRTVDLLHEAGPAWRSRASALAIDLASQLLWSDPDAAAAALERAAPGPRRSLVKADIMAARAADSAETRAAIEAYLAAADEAARARAEEVAALARTRARLLTVNATAALPPEEARRWFDRLALAQDPGEVLVALERLAESGQLDAARVWGGPIRITVDAFESGEPRLRTPASVANVVAHEIIGGAEMLELRYPAASVLTDVWEAPLRLRTAEPRLAFSVRVRSPGRLGDQLCLRTGRGLVHGSAGEPDSDGWRRMVVRGFASKDAPADVSAWCFDTRGRPGPFFLDDAELFLDASR